MYSRKKLDDMEGTENSMSHRKHTRLLRHNQINTALLSFY